MNKLLPLEPAQDIDALLGLKPSSTPSLRGALARRWKAWLIVAVLAVAAAVSVYALFGRSSNTVRYVTEPVTRSDLHVTVTATGSIQPTSQVEVSSELSGTIRRVFVDYNSMVKAGQVVAELDTDKFMANLDSSRAKLNAAKASVATAEVTVGEMTREYARKKTLAAAKYVSPQDLETAKAIYDRAVAALTSAKAEVGVAEADVTLNETNLNKTRILSPIDGIVLKRNVDPGQTVAASLQAPVLFTIAEDLRQMEVQVDVDEADVGKVQEGQPASFSVDAYPDRSFPAVIRELRYASETVQGVVTYKAVLTVDNAELLLRPGMTATAEIVVQDVTDALSCPTPPFASHRPYNPPRRAADCCSG